MKTFSLRELCDCIQDVIEHELPERYWVCAEVGSMSTRGHCYMELVEKGENGILAAKVRATCWSNVYTLLSAYFTQETGQALRAGMQVLIEVSIEFHAVYGLSLNIWNIDPTYTIGDLAKQRQATIRRLTEEGVMELQQALTIPSLPRRVAVVSSADAAGYEDFCNQLKHNRFGFTFHTHLYPAVMQGDTAPKSIIGALNEIASVEDDWDVVVIIRGGGASSDLGCFDDYDLANHCAQFPLPIIAGIGHTRDVSVVDMVTHTSVKTPTAAAEHLIFFTRFTLNVFGCSASLPKQGYYHSSPAQKRMIWLYPTIWLSFLNDSERDCKLEKNWTYTFIIGLFMVFFESGN